MVKRAGTGKRDRIKNEEQQQVVEEAAVVEEQPRAQETHSEAETEAFAAEVVEVTEQVAEIEKLQPEPEPVVEQPQPEVEPVVEAPAPTAVIEHEELPLPEEVKPKKFRQKNGRRKRKLLKLLKRLKKKRKTNRS